MVPVDGHRGEAAAAAAGEWVRRHLLSRQNRQHRPLPSKQVCDQRHELQQRDGVVPAQVSTLRTKTGHLQENLNQKKNQNQQEKQHQQGNQNQTGVLMNSQ